MLNRVAGLTHVHCQAPQPEQFGTEVETNMEHSRVKEQLARVEESIGVAKEMCERHMDGRVQTYLKSLNRDSAHLRVMLDNGQAAARLGDYLEHLRTTGALLMHSCEQPRHKDTRHALEQLHDELFMLEQYLQ